VIVATARWYQMAERIARQIDTTEPIIACAGAQLRRPADRHDLLDLRMPAEFADRFYTILASRRCIASIAMDEAARIRGMLQTPSNELQDAHSLGPGRRC
jgi:hypothetical protein